MSIASLRQALKNESTHKDATRAAGVGIWGNYVRTMMGSGATGDNQEFDSLHGQLVKELESIEPLQKNEKNSLTSAKCVLKKALGAGKDVWARDPEGARIEGAEGPIPKGKNELQDALPYFDALQKRMAGMQKLINSDEAEPLTEEQRTTMAVGLHSIMVSLGMVEA